MKLENILTKWKLKLLKDSAYSTWHEYVAHNSLDELLYKFYSLGKLHTQQDYKRKKDEIPSKLKYTPGMVINGYKFLAEYPNTKKKLGLFECVQCGTTFIKSVYSIVYNPQTHHCLSKRGIKIIHTINEKTNK